MTFLAPLMLLGLAGLAIPVVLHLIGRRRARVVKFAALAFLIGSRRKTSRRLQLRERALLIVRVLACIALPLAIAKPFTSCRARGPTVQRGPQAAVFVIDDSFTSGYRLGGRSILAREVEAATRILGQLGPEAEVAVVRASEGAPSVTELSREQLRLRDALLDLEPSARPADLRRALARAAQLLDGSSHKQKTVYLVSPLTVNALPAGDAPWAADGPALEVVDVRGGAALPNLAVTSLTVTPDPTAGPRGIAIVAEIVNHGPTPVADVPVSVEVAGAVVARGQLDLAPGETRGKRFLATMPAEQRSAPVAVSIRADALPTDDRRHAIARLRDDVRVLLVDGDARADRHEDEVFYLEAALRPGDRGEAGTVVTKILPDDLDDVDLGAFDVVVLANVAALPSPRVEALAAWLRSGGGLLVAPGDHVDPAAYEATMLPLLPQSLRDPIDTAWGAAPDERAARALHLTKWEADHPIFAPFAEDAPGLADAAFTKVMLLGPTTATTDRRVLARFTNGAAAMVLATVGDGQVLLYTSTIDRDWNDLPVLPGYLPLMQESVRFLARRRGDTLTKSILVGQGQGLPTLELKKLEVRGPDGLTTVFEGARLDGRPTVRFGAAERPGVYRVIGTDGTGATRDRDELAFAANLDPRGSDLSPAPPSVLPVSGAPGTTGGKAPLRRVELWHAVAAALLALLVLESILIQQKR
ncbi:MAG: BatA domain-containing protein [Myxococcales bacterium]|nr:BatA domain-containing protein [Myxococcales bacterium]